MVSFRDTVQHAGVSQRPRRGCAAAQRARAERRIAPAHLRRNQPARAARQDHPADPQERRQGSDRPRRRSVESVSARSRSGAAVPRRRTAGLHGRLPHFRLHRHAAGIAEGNARSAGPRDFVLRGRIRRRPARSGAARRLGRQARRPLQLHEGSAVARRRSGADPAAPYRAPYHRDGVEHRSRAWLPLSMLVLHDHQRAGAQEPPPHGGRSRACRPPELCAGHQAVFHHRRQSRPQRGLGIALRPHGRK